MYCDVVSNCDSSLYFRGSCRKSISASWQLFAIFVGTLFLWASTCLRLNRQPQCGIQHRIDAPPEKVWSKWSLSPNSSVEDWLFKTGLPILFEPKLMAVAWGSQALYFLYRIIRRAHYGLDSPRELRFGVSQQPSTMQSWTFYKFLLQQEGHLPL